MAGNRNLYFHDLENPLKGLKDSCQIGPMNSF